MKNSNSTSTKTAKGKKTSSSKHQYMGIPLPADSKQRRRVRNKLSAQAFRKRKQDTLATAKQEVANYDAEINKLRMQLYDVSWIMSVYSIRIDMNHHNHIANLLIYILHIHLAYRCVDEIQNVFPAINYGSYEIRTWR